MKEIDKKGQKVDNNGEETENATDEEEEDEDKLACEKNEVKMSFADRDTKNPTFDQVLNKSCIVLEAERVAINEFENDRLAAYCFPTLFPYGTGSPF